MATANIATNTELALVTTLTQSLTLNLPNNAPTGKSLYIKDAAGTSVNSTITILTQGSDTFEDGSVKQILNQSYGSYQLTYNPTKWYITGGTFYNTINISSVTTQILISTNTISSLYTTVSSLSLVNQFASTNTFNTTSSLLYYNNNLVGGGFREAIPQNVNKFQFSLFGFGISNLTLWYDASDPTSVLITGGVVTSIKDKSGNNNNLATTAGSPTYVLASQNGLNGVQYTGAALYQTGNFIMSPLANGNTTSFVIANTNATTTLLQNTNNYGFYNMFINTTNYQTDIMGNVGSTSFTNTINTTNMYQLTSSNTNSFPFVNGISYGGNTTGGSIYWLTLSAGLRGNNSIIYEIILFSSYLTTFQRQYIEGYLAWKWGIQANLPAGHPYKNAPP